MSRFISPMLMNDPAGLKDPFYNDEESDRTDEDERY